MRKVRAWSLAGVLAGICVCAAMPAFAAEPLSLAGEWRLQLDPENRGLTENWPARPFAETVTLPGSLDQNGKGTPDTEPHRSYLSRKVTYTGAAWYQRSIEIPQDWQSLPVEVFLERCHWETRLWVDGVEAGMRDSLCAPHVYPLPPLTPGPHILCLRVDNSMKYPVGVNAHSVTEHTQTNWNGVVGRMEMRTLPPVEIVSVRVFPEAAAQRVRAGVVLRNLMDHPFDVRLSGEVGAARGQAQARVAPKSDQTVELEVPLDGAPALWDEFHPKLHELVVRTVANHGSAAREDTRRVSFGFRDIAADGMQLTLNGNPHFLRGTLECCIFPLTGYPPTDAAYWDKIMSTVRRWGLNHLRFHSWCPPEAAFTAADAAGITFQVETPVWTDLGKFPDLDQFIRDESDRILEAYGNHPSFAMLAVGNEPSGPDKEVFLNDIVPHWQKKDPRRLYTTCSGWPELPVSDYHVLPERNRIPYRIHGRPVVPSTDTDYVKVMEGATGPVVSHELGQWCVYPSYEEIPKYTGALEPRNLIGFRESLRRNGMPDLAVPFSRASGRLQLLMYKADMEAVLRTPGAGGYQLLALHDFPGQGSALEGFLDAFWDDKGAVSAGEFRRFTCETVPLLRVGKFVWTAGETLTARAEIAHFGEKPLKNAKPGWMIRDAQGQAVAEGAWEPRDIPLGNGTALGDLSWPLAGVTAPGRYTISVVLEGTPYLNQWSVWVYPPAAPQEAPEGVTLASEWSRDVEKKLKRGGTVLLCPEVIAPMRRVRSAFEPIFWNTQWFPGQNRQLGILCDPAHPALAAFPTDGHTDWQWWELLDKSQFVRLDDFPEGFLPLVQGIDDWNKNRKLGAVFEAKVGKGRLLVCTLDIAKDLDKRPAAAALRRSLLAYAGSDAFAPKHEVKPDVFRRVFAQGTSSVVRIEADSAASGFAPENAVDGDPDTIWHTPFSDETVPYPHELRIQYAREMKLAGLKVLPRQDVANAYIGRYEVYTAPDGRHWKGPVAEGEFPAGKAPQTVKFAAPVKTSWIKFVALSSAAGDNFAAVAELEPLPAK
ncbi:MAG: hypothetical protein GXY15_06750 [Candidatus Hydrogenedentes bacterium]|nr:hypothetical protein [Candidatus Hydrogenedentota bacterium]